jgi:hydrophobic/amphiphilic exporter-1 (mainly G- bacteria), HAE1 family
MNLTKLALTRPVFIFVLMLTAILVGRTAFQGMRKENNPEVNFGTLTVTTAYPGAGPEDVNQLITRKVEEAVSGVNGIREVQGLSQEGVSAVVIQLELGVNTETALNDVRTKVDSILNELPKDALKPTISKFDNSAQPILFLAAKSSKLNSRDLRDILDDKIVDRFSQVNGVATVSISGGDIREIQIRLKKEKLLQYGVGVLDLYNAVQGANANIPGGKFIAGGQDISVRVKSDFTNVEKIRDVVLRVSDPNNPNAKAKQIPITEVAEIVDTVKEPTRYARINGEDTVVLAVQKTREGNTVEVNTAIKALLPEVEKLYPVKFTVTYDESTYVDEALKDVTFSLIFGVFLVALIVYIFLHDFRGTLIVALAIPTCIFAAFIVMKAFGFTVNTLSMLGLSLAIGVLVDDAIVVLENIYRHLKMGEDPREAAINGRAEIGVAAIAITLADVVVFAPIGFAGGVAGQFFKPLALTYVFAVLFSLFVSFTLTPLLAARWYKRGEDLEHPKGRFAIAFEKWFGNLEKRYRRILEWSLAHRWFVFVAGNTVLLAIFMLIGGSFAPDAKTAIQTGTGPMMMYLVLGLLAVIFNFVFYRRVTFRPLWGAALFGLVFPLFALMGMAYGNWKQEAVFKFSFIPSTDAIQVKADIELPVGSSLDETDKIARLVEKEFVKTPDIKFTLTEVGKQGGSQFASDSGSSNFATIEGTLVEKRSLLDKASRNPEKLRDNKAAIVVADLTKRVGQVPGAKVNIATVSGFNFGRPIQLSLVSDDRAKLTKAAQTIRDRLAAGEIEGVINPEVSVKNGKPEIQVVPNYRRAADLGIDPNTIGTAVRTLYQGNDDAKLRIGGREYGVRVMMDYQDRNQRDSLLGVPLRFSQGKPIFISEVADLNEEPGYTAINRRNRSEEIQVSADLLPGKSNGVVGGQIQEWLKKEKLLPDGVTIKASGEADVQARESAYLMNALLLGLFLVYAVLAALYNNWLYPMIIQLAQPQAMVGALLALVITDQAFSVIGFIGVVALVGLVGKNAILLVDYTNTLRERGRSRHDAIVEAGPTRLRPIMMTTLALILGTLPVAMALGRGSEFRQSIGTIVLGGIILSTFLTLVVIPCSYTIFDDLSNLFSKWFRKPMAFGGPDGFSATETPAVAESDADDFVADRS